MDIHDYLRVLQRNFVLIIAATLIGVSAGTVLALTTPPRYQASTELFLSVPTGADTPSWELTQGRAYAQQVISSYVEIIPSALVLQPVIDDLGLPYTAPELAAQVSASTGLRSMAITVTATNENPGRAARIANAVSESFATVVAETLEKKAADQPSTIRIDTLQAAQVPLKPAAPNVPLMITMGGLLGLAAGIAIAVLRTVLDTRVRTVKDVEDATGAPTLGGIAFDPNAKERPLIVASAARDPRAEAFRSLRTNVRFLTIGGGPSVFVITSAGQGEGKSTTAANLAIAFAESGARVALVDGDLRLPRVADYFAIEGGVGLSDVLVGRVTASDALQRWGRGTLFLLPAGTVPPNPAELVGSTAMHALLAELKAAFDIIIIDAPPVLLVTDAAVMARFSDGALMVTAAGRTNRSRLTAATQSIAAVGARVAGTIITMLPTTGPDKTAYGSYTYGAQHLSQ